jgi:hypothetical protein
MIHMYNFQKHKKLFAIIAAVIIVTMVLTSIIYSFF